MSHQSFFDDNVTLANSLAGNAELTAERIVKRDITIQSEVTLAPALILWPGDGQSEFDYMPVSAGTSESGTWTAMWLVFLPTDPNAITTALRQAHAERWETLINTVKSALMDPTALIGPTRPNAPEVRWGEEPPMWLQGSQAPNGLELWFTVQQREY